MRCAKTEHTQDILSRIWKRQRTCLKRNSRLGQHFSEKPCKCYSYCNTIKKYIFSDQWLKIGIEKNNFKMEVHARGYAVIRSVKEERTRQ